MSCNFGELVALVHDHSPFYGNDNGGCIVSDMSGNEIAQPEWFTFLCDGDEYDINHKKSARTAKWRLINFVFRMVLRLGISRSNLVMDMANGERSTPLHWCVHARSRENKKRAVRARERAAHGASRIASPRITLLTGYAPAHTR